MRRMPRITARARPAALPVPDRARIGALATPELLDAWDPAVRPAAVATGDNVITMFDVVGEDFWSGGGVTAKGVTAQLRAIGHRPIEVQINSPGGDMFEGITIFNLLRDHPQPVTMKVFGIAASAASLIAMAGDTVEIGANAMLMIHNCMVAAIGNRHDMAEVAAYLAPHDANMAALYAARTGGDAAEIAAWMDAETFMDGPTAIARGFADTLLGTDQIVSDPQAAARQLPFNAMRKLELAATASGMTRAQARDAIKQIKGTPGAANDGGMPGAAANLPVTAGLDWLGDAAALATAFRS